MMPNAGPAHAAAPPAADALPAGSRTGIPPPGSPRRAWRSIRHPARSYRLEGDAFVKRGEPQALLREHAALRILDGAAAVPRLRALEVEGGHATLTLDRIEGRRLDLIDLPPHRLAVVLARAAGVVVRLARRGVRHNDLRMENWIVSSDGRLHLVDFERAERATPLRCLTGGLFGRRGRGPDVRLGLVDLVRSWVRDRLPPAVLRRLRTRPPASLRLDGPVADPARLRQAWDLAAASDASSPGRKVAYHRLRIGELDLPGERDFGMRWRAIGSAVDWEGRRVLEIGCNLALFSTFALRERGAAAALGVDRDPAVLEAAALAGAALGVAPMLAQVDLDGVEPWERLLGGFEPDVVVALSVLHWLADPNRLLRFLGRCPLVLYEGHDSAHRERQRLLAAGFEDVERVLTSERGRAVFLCHGAGRGAGTLPPG